MTSFDTIAVVDWSGGNDTGPRPRKDAIWAAVARDGIVAELEYLRNRQLAERWLVELCEAEIAAGRRVLIGFDFPFGYPEGFAARVAGRPDPVALWDVLAERLADAPAGNNRFALAGELNALFSGVGPFWFNGGRVDVPGLPHKGRDRTPSGLAERRRVEERAKGAFTCWQMGGAGAVGSQAMTGMATLSRLRARLGGLVRVWPFEPLDAAVALVEVWPSLVDDAVRAETGEGGIRDAAQVRVLARAIMTMQTAGTLEEALDAVPTEARREEGWILGVGAEPALRAAAAPSRDDCFALPPGVEWTPVDEALERLRDALECVAPVEEVAVEAAAGRILAVDASALRSNPPAANAAVDGYAFRREAVGEGPATLPLVQGRAAAGEPFRGPVPAGHAVRILTGALLPEGTDTALLQEDATVADGCLHLRRTPKTGANVRRAGEDVEAGEVALSSGRVLGPPDLALLSAVGVARVSVRRRLRVGVLSTGDEVVEPGDPAPPERTYDANRPMLLSVLERWGHAAQDLGRVGDDRKELRRRLDAAAESGDAVLTSGGASGGDEDHVSALLSEAGTVSTWRIAVKPGRPLVLGRWRGVPVFGLPGNPVAALVTTLVFARPALSLLAGAGWVEPGGFAVPAAFEKRKKPGRREYLRARMTAEGRVEVFASEGSGRISGLSWAGGLVELPDAALHVRPGDAVRFLPWSAFGL